MFSLFGKHKCPACNGKMYSDGNNLYCSRCGFEVEVKNHKKSKKYGYRTAYDRDHKESDENSDVRYRNN